MATRVQRELTGRTLAEVGTVIEILRSEVRDPFPRLLVPGVEKIQERLREADSLSHEELYATQRMLLLLPELVQQVDLLATTLLGRAVLKAADVIGAQIHSQTLEQSAAGVSSDQSALHSALLWAGSSAAVADLRRIEPFLQTPLEGELEQLRRLALGRLAGRPRRPLEVETPAPKGADAGMAQHRRRFLVVGKDGSRPDSQALALIRRTLREIGREQRLGALDASLQANRRIPVFQIREDLAGLATERLGDFRVEEDVLLSAEDLTIKLTDPEGQPLAGIPIIFRGDGATPSARATDYRGWVITGAAGTVKVDILPEHSFWSHCLEWSGDGPAGGVKTISLLPIAVSSASWWREEYSGDDSDGRGEGVRIALIDTGVAQHHDLDPRGGLTVTGLGSLRWDEDATGHGTFCAGIINGQGLDGGVRGLAPRADLWGIRAADEDTRKEFFLSNVIDALYEAVDEARADLINMSLGGRVESGALERAVWYAWEHGALVVAAAGNSAEAGADFPARFAMALGVSGYGRHGTFPPQSRHMRAESSWVAEEPAVFVASFSNYGLGVDLCAPGVAICSTYPGNRYRIDDGTSFAAPFVTGVAARLLGRDRSLLESDRGPERARRIKELILTRAGRMVGLPSDRQGHGRLK